MQHSSGVPGRSCFRGHCPLIFLEMGMADVHITSSFSEPPLSGYCQDLRSHLRSLHILTCSWSDAKSSQFNSNFMFNPCFIIIVDSQNHCVRSIGSSHMLFTQLPFPVKYLT